MRSLNLLCVSLLLLLNGGLVKGSEGSTESTPTDDPALVPESTTAGLLETTTTTAAAYDHESTSTAVKSRWHHCEQLNCAENERCEERDGVYGCYCKEDQSTQNSESFDSVELCESSSGSMSLSRCQLLEAGFPADVLHLSDPSCRGTVEDGRVMFHFDNDDHICGTNLTGNGTHIIYENTIQGETDSSGGLINRKKDLELRFSCIFQVTQILTMDTEFNPVQRIVHKVLPGDQGFYQIRMIPYMDAGFSHSYNGSVDIEVGQRIYVGVFVDGVDDRQISTVIDSCWATPVNVQNYGVRWDLIVRKCPNQQDKTVEVLQNGVSTSSRFSFGMFAFNDGNYNKVFLHCTIQLCIKQGNNCAARCNPGHHRRPSRSVGVHDSTAISMGPFTWTATSTGL